MLLQVKVNSLTQLPKSKSTVNRIQLLHCSPWAEPFKHVALLTTPHLVVSQRRFYLGRVTGNRLRWQGTGEVVEAKQEATDVSIRHV